MPKTFRVIDLRGDIIDPEPRIVEAPSPIAAAQQVLELDLVRSGAKKDLVARVYWQSTPNEPQNMLRLYRRLDLERRHLQPSAQDGVRDQP